MNSYRVDLHVHTVLSPCGSLEMSPVNVVNAALKAKLDLIAITDHNSTRQAKIVRDLGQKRGLKVYCGAEVNTSEEVHCLALFETDLQLDSFQQFLDNHLIVIENNPDYFGYQVIVDEDDLILDEENRLLISSLDVDIHRVEQEVHALSGLFIPAHIDRPHNGILRQLGFIPPDLHCDAFGLSVNADPHKWLDSSKLPANATIIRNSDAHSPEQLGSVYSIFKMNDISFDEMRKALLKADGREVLI
jgi:3',5'-nucleoside bisphosphate phosphatase